jgi:hypothetical protein
VASNTELIDKLAKVIDAESFLDFVRALIADREAAVAAERTQPRSPPYGPDAGGWENDRIEAYLFGASAWAESTDFGVRQGLAPGNLWARFANFLYAGKIYE